MNLRLIQNWYDKMAQRERLMLAGFAWAIVLLWLGLVVGQLKTLKKNITQVNSDLSSQNKVLATGPEVENRLKKVQTDFKNNPISASELYQLVSTYNKASGLNAPMQQLPSSSKKVFSVNTVTVTFTKTPLRTLMDFASRVLQKAPYLAIDTDQMHADKVDPTLLSGEMRINSLELKLSPTATPSSLPVTDASAKR